MLDWTQNNNNIHWVARPLLAITKTKNDQLVYRLKLVNKYSNKKENKIIVFCHFILLFYVNIRWWNLFLVFKRQRLVIEIFVIFILPFFQNKVSNYMFCIMQNLPHHWEHILNLCHRGISIIVGIQHSRRFPYLIRTLW